MCHGMCMEALVEISSSFRHVVTGLNSGVRLGSSFQCAEPSHQPLDFLWGWRGQG